MHITLLGMSGVGKTTLADKLPRTHWFHYSADYRIGSHYLNDELVDTLKLAAMKQPYLRDLLKNDSIYIGNNISFKNLGLLSSWLGKIGNPEQGGLKLEEFKRRQRAHYVAETNAMLDVPNFIRKAKTIYNYPNFLNDASGSLCELDNPEIYELLAKHTRIVYLEADESLTSALIERAIASPKPLYYSEKFFDAALAEYMQRNKHDYIAEIAPDNFVRWVFEKLVQARLPKYKAIADQYGISIPADVLYDVETEDEFIELINSY